MNKKLREVNLFVIFPLVLTVFVLLTFMINVDATNNDETQFQVTFENNLTYDEKLQFVSEKEQMIGHILSSLNATKYEDYNVAKMHLMHPLVVNFPIMQSIVSESDGLMNKLELTLESLAFVEPKNDHELLQHKLAPIFKILTEIEEKIVGDQLKQDTIFQLKLVVLLLEKSLEHHEDYLKLDDGVAKTTKKQDSFSLAIKSHLILFPTPDANFDESIKTDFANMFFSYQKDMDKATLLKNQVIEKINIIIEKNTKTSFEDKQTTKNPTIVLEKIEYSTNNYLIVLRGENFEQNQIITIEYFSPVTDASQMIKGTTTSDGVIYFPLEFSQDVSSPYLFSVISGNIVIFEALFAE